MVVIAPAQTQMFSEKPSPNQLRFSIMWALGGLLCGFQMNVYAPPPSLAEILVAPGKALVVVSNQKVTLERGFNGNANVPTWRGKRYVILIPLVSPC